jgi:putative DNA methylase
MTIPKDCKRLAEVDFPIAKVSFNASAEKDARVAHIPKLHIWPAARPTGSSRSILLSLLLPDPCDVLCPQDFKQGSRKILSSIQNLGESDMDLRQALFRFIGDFSNWDLAANQKYVEIARQLVELVNEEKPLVVDPFSGGGSIPLEAQRVGCEAFATDLNPVAILILKVILEDIPNFGKKTFSVEIDNKHETVTGLAEAINLLSEKIKTESEKKLIEYYPLENNGSRPIAYIWARTVNCESPNCGAEIPLLRSFWLVKKTNRKKALRYQVVKNANHLPKVSFEIFTPMSNTEVPKGTIARVKATCLCCGSVLPSDRVRNQIQQQKGGADVIFDKGGNRVGGALLVAVALTHPSETGRKYRLATSSDYAVIYKAKLRLEEQQSLLINGLSAIPDESTPLGGGSGAGRAFSIRNYGIETWGDLFSIRQKLALSTFSSLVANISSNSPAHRSIVLNLSKMIDMNNTLATWQPHAEIPAHMMTRFAIPMKWDFAESVPISESSGTLTSAIKRSLDPYPQLVNVPPGATVQLEDAASSPLPDSSAHIWFTDPPYYDAVPYADLSDFFYVWHKRSLNNNQLIKDPFDKSNRLTPKDLEIVQDEIKTFDGKPKDRLFFEEAMTRSFLEGRRILRDDGIGCVVFAHKTTEGWEALLTGLIKGGWVITGSWPIATEMTTRLRARESAALATSIHLVIRPRSENAEIGDWAQVSRELPRKVGDWMQRLQSEGVRGADLVFACIGPALEIYSRYSKVVDAEDREIPLGGDPEAREPHLRGYLAYVWEVVGRLALEQVLGTSDIQKENVANALEEDARLTALFLWTKGSVSPQVEKPKAKSAEFEEESDSEAEDDEEETPKKKGKGGYSLPFDVVRRIAQPLGIHLPEWEHRIIETEKGVVTLLSVKDRARQLFGEEGASAFASDLENDPSKPMQMNLFSDVETGPKVRGKRKSKKEAETSLSPKREATTLDRLHAAMLLQKSGQTTALRAMLQSESERGSDFMRLANALSALYPRESEEKRLLDALLVNVRR